MIDGIPADVACPFCGGYVRGHQWIGTDDCSVTVVFEEPVSLAGRYAPGLGHCDRCGEQHVCEPFTIGRET